MADLTGLIRLAAADLIKNGDRASQANVQRWAQGGNVATVLNLSDTAFSRFAASVAREQAAQLQEAEDMKAFA